MQLLTVVHGSSLANRNPKRIPTVKAIGVGTRLSWCVRRAFMMVLGPSRLPRRRRWSKRLFSKIKVGLWKAGTSKGQYGKINQMGP